MNGTRTLFLTNLQEREFNGT